MATKVKMSVGKLSRLILENKQRLIEEIKMVYTPYLHDSGYGDTKLAAIEPALSLPTVVSVSDYSGSSVNSIEGFVEDGVITDTYGGGLVTQDFDSLCIEDLIKILRAVQRIPKERFK